MIEKLLINLLEKRGYIVSKRDDFVSKRIKLLNDAYIDYAKITQKNTWSAINPVIHSLKELRKNTWDVGRVDHAIQWLKDNFEVEK